MALAMAFATPWSNATAQTPGLYDLDTVREFRLYFSQSNYWTQMRNNYASKTNIAADLKVDGVTYANVGVQGLKNSASTSKPTSPIQIKSCWDTTTLT
jgi:spore coat protein CotH